MKKIFVLFLIFLLNIISFSNEKITNFDVDFKVNKNGSVDVIERISYVTDEYGKRGIYRNIPYKYDNASVIKFENKIGIYNFKATYLNGTPTGLYSQNEDNVMYNRLGKEDVFLKPNEEYTYVISYTMYNLIRTSGNIKQIYINAIGNYWEIPIEKYRVKISGINGDVEVYTGNIGETNKEYSLDKSDGVYIITSTKNISLGEGMSFIINSTDFVYSSIDMWYNRIMTYPVILLLLILIPISLFFSILRFIYGIKHNKLKSIVVEYMPPNISPLIAKKLMNKNKNKYSMIVLFQLIQKGIIKFREKNPKHNNEEYVREVGKPIEKNKKQFNDYVEKEYYLDMDLINDINLEISNYEKVAIKNLILVKNDIFKKSKAFSKIEFTLNQEIDIMYLDFYSNINARYILPYIFILIFLVIGFIAIFGNQILDGIIISPLIIVLLTSSYLLSLRKYTDRYKDELAKIKGFEKFLVKVEANKFKEFLNVEDLVSYFNEILPFAVALELENKYLELLNKSIEIYGLDREYIYDNVYYYYLLNRGIYYGNINESIMQYGNKSSNNFGGNSNFSGGFSSGGSSGGGFSGGGGHSW
ncbi:DUF2207 domain-containing protein [Pseudostreptobacillus sp.]